MQQQMQLLGMFFFIFAENLLDRCEHSARIINLEFHSAALLFNCLDQVLSVPRSVLDQGEDLCCRNNLLQLCDCFSEIHQFWFERMTEIGRRTVSLVDLGSRSVAHTSQPGRPKFVIAEERLENLRSLRCTWNQIVQMLRVSRWTIYRRVEEYGLGCGRWSNISDDQLEEVIRGFISRHGTTTGQSYLLGYIRSLGHLVQRERVRATINRVDPENSALRWATVITRRVYSVLWPNSSWHIDGHDSLIRWGFVVHGCIDGFSGMITFLRCSTNNRADTVMSAFQRAVQQFGVPSRVGGDHGGENIEVARSIVRERGEGRGSFIAGPSTRNKRIERLWREVFRCV
ncbi:uncharacterized protein LOC110058094 [Orbicella faveolata]|uniref:uncharacterized protein LOC110058094 n=1 Tax=Orbicella faveolata TaxID=48498 RepID=UPI0009E30D71|nr:uncharacterized protein LOC110058094 [Orbicella faveolata]